MFYKSTNFLYFSQFKRFSVSILGMVRGRANMNALENTYSIVRCRGEVSFEVQQQSTGVAFLPAVMVLSAQLMVHQPNPITHLPTAQKAAAHCCL